MEKPKLNTHVKKQRHHLKHHPILTFGRVIKNGLVNLLRNAWLSVAATAIMTVTLATILLAGLANKALNDTIDTQSRDLTLSIYILEDAKDDRQVELRSALLAQPEVDNIEYVSQQDALEKFKEDYKDDQDLLDAFTIVQGNVLPASFRITVNDLEKIDQLVRFVEHPEYNDVVESTSNENETAKEAIKAYTSQQRLIIAIGVVIAVIFAFISTMVIFNTIRLAIYSRSNEVQIMKLLGASHGYIRGPFLFEASMYGVIAGLLSFGLVSIVIKGLVPRSTTSSFAGEGLSNSLLEYAVPFFNQNWSMLILATVFGGVLIGFISSALALSRYMRY